jgi:hypothetical protein
MSQIGIPQYITDPKKFLRCSNWTLAASGGARVKLQLKYLAEPAEHAELF